MIKEGSVAHKILEFNLTLSEQLLEVPQGYKIINPFNSSSKDQVKRITTLFYQKYYNDNKMRRLILGSSPARRGTAVTGIPFEDAAHIQTETGIVIDNFYVNKGSSNFLYEVMNKYGGCSKFYDDFLMSFVCPLGIVRINSKGNEVNCNYYENKKLEKMLYPFILESLHKQINFNIDTSVCYCIGSGENYKFLLEVNKKYHLFFNHDNSINTKEEFVKRYNNRINNFLKLLKSQKNVLIYTIKMYDNPVDAYVLNAIYDSLSEISENQNINYLFFHMVNNTENNILNKDILNKHVKYNEIKVSQQFLKDWHKVENFNTDLTNKPFHEIYDNIKELYAI